MASIQVTQASGLGLSYDPFPPPPARRSAIHVTPAFARQLEILKKIVATGATVALVKGQQGTGKTTLLNRLTEELQDNMGINLIRVEATDEIDLVRLLGHEFGVVEEELSTDQARHCLTEHLSRLQQGGLTVAVAVDNAHRLPLPSLAGLIELTDPVAPPDYSLLHAVLFAEPDIDAKLDVLPLPRQRLSTLSLGGYSLDETRSYIRHRLEAAGYANGFPFSTSALKRIQRRSKGVPAQINRQAARHLQRHQHLRSSPVAGILCKIRSHQRLLAGAGGLAVVIMMGLVMGKAIWSPIDSTSEAPERSAAKADFIQHNMSSLRAAIADGVDQTSPRAPSIAPSVSETWPEVSDPPTTQERRTEETVVDADPLSPSPSIHGKDWFETQNPAEYVIQVIATSTERGLQSFLTRYDWPAEVSYLQTWSEGRQWHILVLGPYQSRQEAQSMLSSLPEEALRNQPWVRRVGSVQAIMGVLR